MGIADDAAARFLALVDERKRVASLAYKTEYATWVPHDEFHAWRIQVQVAIRTYLPHDDTIADDFEVNMREASPYYVELGIGMLRGLAKAATDGYLYKRLSSLVTAEVFSDFLEMAEHLLDAGHYHAAAGLIGAVLEDSLRKIADANGVTYNRRDGIDSLNQALTKAVVYTAIVKRNVEVWKQVRNDSDHGHFDQVTLEDVRSMHRGVEGFLAQYLK